MGKGSRMEPRQIIDQRPMSLVQIAAVATTIGLNALDGFDVLAISFAAPGIEIDAHVKLLVAQRDIVGQSQAAPADHDTAPTARLATASDAVRISNK